MAVERAEQTTITQDASAESAPPPAGKRPAPRLFDVDEYYRMAEVGILRPDERVELIEGEILQISPIGARHVWAVDRLTQLLVLRFGTRVRLGVQNPIRLARRVEPEPDFALSRIDEDRLRRYPTALPGPDDVLLVIEVAETSVLYDLGDKAELYARHGIPELWVLDLPEDRLMVHREPVTDGYASVAAIPRGASVSPLAFPDEAFTVEEIIGVSVAPA